MNASLLMRRFFISFLFLACVGVCVAVPPVKSSKVANPKTVADYFLLLPSKYFQGPSLAERREWLTDKRTVLDVKNDYLFGPGYDSQGALCIVLFRHAGRVLVAVQSEGYDPPEPKVDFLRYERGRWESVKKQVLDELDVEELDPYYRNTIQLPRHGSTIHVLNSIGLRQYDLVWKNGRFKRVNEKE